MEVLELEPTIWQTIKKTIPEAEQDETKRVLGDNAIDKNEELWTEMESFRDILLDFRQQNREFRKHLESKPSILDHPARNLLEQQIFLLLNSVKASNSNLTPKSRGEAHVKDYVLNKYSGNRSEGETVFTSLESSRCSSSRTLRSPSCSTSRSSINSSPGENLFESIDGKVNLYALEKLKKTIRNALKDEKLEMMDRISQFQDMLEMEHEEIVEEKVHAMPPTIEDMRKYSSKLEKTWLREDIESKSDQPIKNSAVPKLELPQSSKVNRLRTTVQNARMIDD